MPSPQSESRLQRCAASAGLPAALRHSSPGPLQPPTDQGVFSSQTLGRSLACFPKPFLRPSGPYMHFSDLMPPKISCPPPAQPRTSDSSRTRSQTLPRPRVGPWGESSELPRAPGSAGAAGRDFLWAGRAPTAPRRQVPRPLRAFRPAVAAPPGTAGVRPAGAAGGSRGGSRRSCSAGRFPVSKLRRRRPLGERPPGGCRRRAARGPRSAASAAPSEGPGPRCAAWAPRTARCPLPPQSSSLGPRI